MYRVMETAITDKNWFYFVGNETVEIEMGGE